MHRLVTVLCSLASLAIGACIAPSSALAEAKLGVTPSIIRTSGAAGTSVTEPITLSAGFGQDLVVDFEHADYGFDGKTYTGVVIRDTAPETTSFSTRGWFSIDEEPIRIAAGQTVDVTLRIAIPSNTPSGTYIGVALFRARPAGDASTVVRAVPETGPIVFVDVAGGEPPQPKIETFDVPRFTSSDRIKPRIEVGNAGEQVFSVEGSVRIRGAGKGAAAKQNFTTQYVLPDQPRELRRRSQGAGFSLRAPSWLPQRRTVELRMRVTPTNAKIVDTRTVWYIPTPFVYMGLGLLAMLVGLVFCAVFLRRWFVARRRARPTPAPIVAPADTLLESADVLEDDVNDVLDDEDDADEASADEDSMPDEDSYADEDSLDDYAEDTDDHSS